MRNVAVTVLVTIAGAAAAAPVSTPPSRGAPQTPAQPAESPLSPEEAQRRFKLPEGYRIELVASEPLVRSPVAATFDGDGRLWVVEMPGFMRDVAGSGEDEPTGNVVVLSDDDGDGRMDRRQLFLDQLIIPRSVLPLADGGALIAAPPFVYHCRDRNRDLRCDEKVVVASDYGTRKNPEHDANGLVPALDNWLYSANSTLRFRQRGARWERGTTISRGQWGISQDDVGRLMFNTNSDHLRGDLLPAYSPEAHARRAGGLNVRIGKSEAVFPGRVNFVNRGYQSGLLRADGTLAVFTAACGPLVYRGDGLPAETQGNVFLAEPAGNLVRRSVVSEVDGKLVGRNAYEKAEFLTSSDERFRPVNLANGPDGGLYVVDMYRGLIQHRIYLTPYLKEQVHARGLDQPVDRGRIWRVVHDATASGRGSKPSGPCREGSAPSRSGEKGSCQGSLARMRSATLVDLLSHPNGWWRDTAQRTLVERGDRSVVAKVEGLFRRSGDARVRLHALFTLEGLGRVRPALLTAASGDGDRFVRMGADSIRSGEQRAGLDGVANAITKGGRGAMAKIERARGMELELVERLLARPEWKTAGQNREPVLRALAARIAGEGRPARLMRLLEVVARDEPPVRWRQRTLLAGAIDGLHTDGEPLPLPTPPARWARVANADDPELQETARTLMRRLTWPKMQAEKLRKPKLALGPEDQARFERGKQQYKGICGACHQPSGLGEEGKGPPLVDSEWVLGPPDRLVRIALHGLRGPVKVGPNVYEMEMPAMGALGDGELADLLTYVRMEPEWGHAATPIDPTMIARVRKSTESRQEAWTAAELTKVP